MKNLPPIILVVFVLMWSALVHSQNPAPSPLKDSKHVQEKSGKSNQIADHDQRDTKQTAPITVKTIPAPTSKEETNHKAYDRREKATQEWWLTYSTIWLAIVTTALAVFTAYLWAATRNLVRSSEETAKRQLRAFIFGKGFNQGTNSWDGTIREYVFWVTWENVGLTPGIDVCNWIEIKTSGINEEQQIIFAPSNERRPTVMGPRATAQTGFFTVPLETMMQKWRNETRILVWSRVEYRDIFDSDIIHHHEQCASVELIHDPSTIPPEGHPPYVTFTVYGHQNSTG